MEKTGKASEFEFDCVVIGSGPGGYVAAIRAAQLGLKTAVVEKDEVGGVCLNIGCIPSKSLLHSAHEYKTFLNAKQYGVTVGDHSFDYGVVHRRSRAVVKKLTKGVEHLLNKNKVDLIRGVGKISAEHRVTVSTSNGNRTVTARFILIATGSSPRELPFAKFDGERIVNSNHVLEKPIFPKRICIIGAGAVGCEFATVYRSFGSEVHLVEMLPQILPVEDADCAAALTRTFDKEGIKVYCPAKVNGIETGKPDVAVTLERNGKPETIRVDAVLVSVGRKPNSEGVSDLPLATDRGFIKVNEYYQTSVPNVYAIGDVIPTTALAHVASREGEIAVEHMAGKSPDPIDYLKIPSCTYTHPEVASFGWTEAQAKEKNIPHKVYAFPFQALGRAKVDGRENGFVKMIVSPDTLEILGAHIFGYGATEIIHEILAAASFEYTAENIAHMIHAHPTLSESIMETSKGFLDGAIHI
jgi:dihydrolipoamide dehydrogenase